MWDERYAVADYVYGKIANTFLQENVDSLPKGRVLCLAEGEGRNAVFLAGKGYDVSAVDVSSVARDKALHLAREQQVTVDYTVVDLAEYDIGYNRWDAIVSIFCHLPPNLRQQIHLRIAQALAPGGVFLLEAYTPMQLSLGTGGPPTAEMMMDARTLKNELPGLHFALSQEIMRDVMEGVYHTGRGAVVQVIATK